MVASALGITYHLGIGGSDARAAASATPQDSVIVYSGLTREWNLLIKDRVWSNEPTEGDVAAKITGRDGLAINGFDDPVKDCSDNRSLCRKTPLMVIAIPRRGVASDQTYDAGGARFTVEECEHPLDGMCGIALIRGECWHAGGGFPECSSQRTSERDTRSLVFFLFNRSLGVTAMGAAVEIPQTRAEKIEIVSQKILLSPEGLLQLEPQYR